jgi:hypothetical protein
LRVVLPQPCLLSRTRSSSVYVAVGPARDDLPWKKDLADLERCKAFTNALASVAEKVREQCNRTSQRALYVTKRQSTNNVQGYRNVILASSHENIPSSS